MKPFSALRCRPILASILIALPMLCAVLPAHGKGRAEWKTQFMELGEQVKQAELAGDLDTAEKLARDRLNIAFDGPSRAQAVASAGLGNVLRSKGLFAESEIMLRKALVLNEAADVPAGYTFQLRAMINLASAIESQGRLAESNALYRKALALQLQSQPNHVDAIHARTQLAENLIELHQFSEAAALLQQAIAVKPDFSNKDAGDQRSTPYWETMRKAQALNTMGLLAFHQQQWAEALNYLQQAQTQFSAILPPQQLSLLKNSYAQSKVYFKMNKPAEALAILQPLHTQAMAALGVNHPFNAKVEMMLAQCLPNTATSEKNQLFSHAMQVFERVHARDQLVDVSKFWAAYLKETGQPEQALQVSLKGLDAADEVFSGSKGLSDSTREDLATQYTPLYKNTLALLLQLHTAKPTAGYDQQALAVASRTQSRLFTEMLRQADVSNLQGDKDFNALKGNLLARQTELARLQELQNEQIASVNRNDESDASLSADPIVAERMKAYRDKLTREIGQAAQNLQGSEDAMWAKYPRFMELTRPRPVDLAFLQKKVLKADETLVSFSLLDQKLVAFVISQKHFQMVQSPIGRVELYRLIQQIRQPEEDPKSDLSGLKKLDPNTLFTLYEAIFKPLEAALEPARKVLVVGDGPLFTLPLEMLVTQWGPEDKARFNAVRADKPDTLQEYATLHFLGDERDFSYLPSLSSLVSLRLYSKPAVQYQTELISFANPDFKADPTQAATREALGRAQRSLRGSTSLTIPSLPETEGEAREISGILGGKNSLYLGDDAQEHTAKTIDLSKSRYVHFATHGLMGDETSLVSKELGRPTESVSQPALLMSLGGNLQGEDGLLTMGEVLSSLNLNAQLAVLSACNTATGNGDSEHAGEGFAGLTRSFMYAGAKGLLVSHWSVESQSTQDLMTGVFKQIKLGNNSLTALTLARKQLRAKPLVLGLRGVSQAHPYFWAPFVFVGD